MEVYGFVKRIISFREINQPLFRSINTYQYLSVMDQIGLQSYSSFEAYYIPCRNTF